MPDNKEELLREQINLLIEDLKKSSKKFAKKQKKKEIEEKFQEYQFEETASVFSDMIKEVIEEEAETIKEVREKKKKISEIKKQIYKNVELISTDEYEKLLEQIQETNVIIHDDFKEKFSIYKGFQKITEKLSLDTISIFSGLAAQSPMLGLGMKMLGTTGGLLFSGAKSLIGSSSANIGTSGKEKLLKSYTDQLSGLTKTPAMKPDTFSVGEPAQDYTSNFKIQGSDGALLEKIFYNTEEIKQISDDKLQILSKLLQIQEELYDLEDRRRFEELENEREERVFRQKQLYLIKSDKFDSKDSKSSGILDSVKDSVSSTASSVLTGAAGGAAAGGLMKKIPSMLSKGLGITLKAGKFIATKVAAPLLVLDAVFSSGRKAEELGVSKLAAGASTIGTLGLDEFLPDSARKFIAENMEKSIARNPIMMAGNIGLDSFNFAYNKITGKRDNQDKVDELLKLTTELNREQQKETSNFTDENKKRQELRILTLQEKILKLQEELLKDQKISPNLERNQEALENKLKISEKEKRKALESSMKSEIKDPDILYNTLSKFNNTEELSRTTSIPDTLSLKNPSTAYGPAGVTYELVKEHMKKGTFKTDEEKEFAKKLLEQNRQFIFYSQGKIKDSKYAPGAKGTLTSSEDKKMYEKVSKMMIEKDVQELGTEKFYDKWVDTKDYSKTQSSVTKSPIEEKQPMTSVLEKSVDTSVSNNVPVYSDESSDPVIDALYRSIAKPETGGEKDPFIRTRAPEPGKPHSSAYGPVQITYSLVQEHMKKGTFKTDEEKEFAQRFIDQGKKFIHHSQGKISDSRFGYGQKGELTSDEDKKNYERMAKAMMKHDLEVTAKGDPDLFARQWRYGVEGAKTEFDSEYHKRFLAELKNNEKIQVAQNKIDIEPVNEKSMISENLTASAKTNDQLKAQQMAKNNVSINNVSTSPAPNTANGPVSGGRATSVRNTDSTLNRLFDKNYRGTAT